MDLAKHVYALARALPDNERFGLVSQLQRAAVSVPANVAEGYGRMHRRAYANHALIARGSVMELQTHLELTVRLGMLDRNQVTDAWQLSVEIARMLSALISSLRKPKP